MLGGAGGVDDGFGAREVVVGIACLDGVNWKLEAEDEVETERRLTDKENKTTAREPAN